MSLLTIILSMLTLISLRTLPWFWYFHLTSHTWFSSAANGYSWLLSNFARKCLPQISLHQFQVEISIGGKNISSTYTIHKCNDSFPYETKENVIITIHIFNYLSQPKTQPLHKQQHMTCRKCTKKKFPTCFHILVPTSVNDIPP